jgi:hypothetical protein
MSNTTEKKTHTLTPQGIAKSMRAAAEKLKSPSGVHAQALLHYQQRQLLKKQSIAEEKAKKQNAETFLVSKQSPLKTEEEKKEEEEEIIKEILQMNEKHRISSTTYSILEEIEEERINVTKNQAKVATAHNSALAECKKGELVMNGLSHLGISMDISFLYRKAPREIPSWLEMFATPGLLSIH